MADNIHIDLAVTGGRILTLDGDMNEIDKGTILIREGKIYWIGPEGSEPEGITVKDRINAGGKLVIPAFFNSHSHAAMSLFRGLGSDLSLDRWLNEFIWPAERRHLDPESVYIGTRLSVIEMIRSGTGIFSDMYFFEDQVAMAAAEAGMRCIVGEGLLDFPTPGSDGPATTIRHITNQYQSFKNHDLVFVAVAVHSPYTCSPGLIVEAASLANELNLPVNVHLAETEGETTTIRSRYRMSPTEYLGKYGLLGSRTVAHHCIHLSPDDIGLLKDSGTSAVTLPNSNMKLGSGACPVSDLLEAGINVALGTDGPASNNSQSMVRELQQLGRLERIRTLDPTCLSSRELLQMATIRGACAYGLDHLTGSLEPGKSADLQIIDTGKPHWQPLYDPFHSIAYAMQSEDIETLVIAGKILMKERSLTLIDEERILWEAKKLAGKIL